jgi:hypothetical protein
MEIMRKAVEAAKEIAGVRTVDSELELDPYYGNSGPFYYGPYRGPYYYGRAYPYQPHVMPPHAGARGRLSQAEDRTAK